MRIVLDTNQLLRALMRPPELATFLMAWQAGRFLVVASPEILQEYQRLLSEPAVANLLYPELVRMLRTHLIYAMEIVTPTLSIQICRDPDDNKFLSAAIFASVELLVTQDSDLLTKDIKSLLQQFDITTCSIDQLIAALDE